MASEYLQGLGLEVWHYENPQKYDAFWMEKVDGNELRYWARHQLTTCSIICFLYFWFIHIGPIVMKNRKPYNLRGPLIVWNFLLAVFSIAGVVRILPEFLYLWNLPNGFHRSACTLEGLHYPSSFWGFLYTLSKIAELGDTVFIVLRKKPLVFLHWFHHLTMVWCTFYTFSEGEPYGRYVGLINMGVHSVMYTYYFLKALKIRVPRMIAMMITSIQILQLISILFVNLYSYVMYASGSDCYRTETSVKMLFFFASIYLYQFSKLFYNSYIVKHQTKSSLKKMQ